ncbi:hypothetical protein BN1049_02298 [Pseudomonas saudimassiliensis]|uniref:Uncharacterized protein n=1 Tax=Pseudomonas saudimassiliensis TaxID=1461581 RepID=A0A078MM77_9PSED|nr:hypothetical protein BN1049_02298 [Pseudomonas saudimassiliensis]CEF27350.1 hypothetical protein BN1049_02298 [Pseudomonas saudimassiliensis]
MARSLADVLNGFYGPERGYLIMECVLMARGKVGYRDGF